MKLNQLQINKIDKILEESGIVYIDYKFEILDHIATEIEKLMEDTFVNFDEALLTILKKWSPQFKKSADLNFGLIWILPEILKRKAKRLYWKKMLQLLAATIIFTPILLLFKDNFSENLILIKYSIWAIILIQFIGYIVIKISKSETTFGFLYKQQFLAFLAMYFISLYTLNSNNHVFERPIESVFPVFYMISFLALAPISNFKFLKEHFSQLKRNSKFI
ncbi:hypothetical protein [Flavobacterium sp. SM2513]|uniref:hypothetical protein n=1 Tax=Flavobacterium sp. SM2513 TaxID=3424766 RepID=UPI003D7F2829